MRAYQAFLLLSTYLFWLKLHPSSHLNHHCVILSLRHNILCLLAPVMALKDDKWKAAMEDGRRSGQEAAVQEG
ncbi:hypothetical protein ACH5RR_023277 [Cinchona calisaya]|uniref:Uncharacterized protein n=1 Tax=Cinchona calisaya TaxID=153742 RepID=A0ABD2ZDN1_9GENT